MSEKFCWHFCFPICLFDIVNLFPFIIEVLEERYTQVLAARAKRLDDLQRKGKKQSTAERRRSVSFFFLGCSAKSLQTVILPERRVER